MMKHSVAIVVLHLFSNCAAASGSVASALINTAIAVGVSGARRAEGDCYTPCNPGSFCNKDTGLCDPLPCGGRCNFNEFCQQNYDGERCVNTSASQKP
jgi:hypothetical protein